MRLFRQGWRTACEVLWLVEGRVPKRASMEGRRSPGLGGVPAGRTCSLWPSLTDLSTALATSFLPDSSPLDPFKVLLNLGLTSPRFPQFLDLMRIFKWRNGAKNNGTEHLFPDLSDSSRMWGRSPATVSQGVSGPPLCAV